VYHASPRDTIALVLIWALVTAINIAKPVTIDDASYLENAWNIVAQPLHPMSGLSNWSGTPQPTHHRSPPALHFYMLAAVLAAVGESQLALHALIALFAAASIALFYSIATRVGAERPVFLTALVFAGPAFIPSQNLMIEVPQLCFWLLFFRMLLSPSRSAAVGAGVAAAAACLAKYTSIVLVPVLAIDLLARRRFKQLWVVAIPVAALVGWSAFNYLDYGGIHVFESLRGIGEGRAGWYSQGLLRRIAIRLRDWIVCAGGVAPFALLFFSRYLRPRRTAIALSALAGTVAVLLAAMPQYSRATLIYHVLRALFVANGFVVLLGSMALAAGELLRWHPAAEGSDSDGMTLSLWCASAIGSILVGSPFMAVRHLLQAWPPILLLMGRRAAIVTDAGHVARRIVLVGSIGLGVCLGVSDWLYAAAQRDAAGAIAARYRAGYSPPRVWFVGHWGWQWYASHAGMTQIDIDRSRPASGDYLAQPDFASGREIPPRLAECLQPVEHRVVPAPAWDVVRTMAPMASFYTDVGHRLPWTLGRAPLLSVDVFEVRRDCP
jgi:4-amino-4-deoxy-L-arabinose transferase-like glycosyltransferase